MELSKWTHVRGHRIYFNFWVTFHKQGFQSARAGKNNLGLFSVYLWSDAIPLMTRMSVLDVIINFFSLETLNRFLSYKHILWLFYDLL